MINPFTPIIVNNKFRSLWYGQIFSQISLNILSFLLMIEIYYLTKSNAAVSLMLFMIGFPAVFFGIIAGVIVEKLDKRKVLFYGNFTRALILILFVLFYDNITILYFLAFLISVVTQFFIPAEAPSIPLLVPQKELLSANSLFTISFYLSTVLGYVFAGPLVNIINFQGSFIVSVILMFISSYFLFLLPNYDNKIISSKIFEIRSIYSRFQNLIKLIISNSRILQSILLMSYTQVLIAVLSVLAPGFADKVLSIKLTDASVLVMGPAAFGLIVGAFIVGILGKVVLKSKIIYLGLVSNGLILLFLSFVENFDNFNIIFITFLLFLLGTCLSFISVPANTVLQEEGDNSSRAGIYGLLTSITGGVALIPVMVSGILADYMGIGKTLLILSILIIFLSIFYLPGKVPYLFTKKI
jgi:MFS family permease